MGHRGGYAYRLCKVNDGKVWEVTEQCFQNGHLNFSGDTTWIYINPYPKNFNPENFKAQPIKTTTIGTTPPGSQWAKINLWEKSPDNGGPSPQRWAIKDFVEVPESLELGQYILSFRWDSLRTPQVWNTCANIEIRPADMSKIILAIRYIVLLINRNGENMQKSNVFSCFDMIKI